jgi:hypothetical protein
MDEFIAEPVEVEQAPGLPQPARFLWRREKHEVAKIVSEWVDLGHGQLPETARRWYTRHHRRYYVVEDTAGVRYELYLDYANRKRPAWILTRKLAG